MNEKSYLGRFFEGLFLILIILVILQTFSEEVAAFLGFGVLWRKRLLFAGFGFDLIFTVEFITRLGRSRARRGAGTYLVREFGFVDLLSSVPLLLLHSGPLLFSYFSGSFGLFASLGVLNLLKAVKIIRVTRILRFLRTLKLFGKTRPRYIMTSRYVARALVIVTSVMILSLIGFTYVDNGNVMGSKSEETARILQNYVSNEKEPRFDRLLTGGDSILFIEHEGGLVYQGVSKGEFEDYFFDDDYFKRSIDGYEVTFSLRDRTRLHSFVNLLVYTMIIGAILLLTTLYRGHFNRHISNNVGVMLKGFKTEAYSTPVRIAKRSSDLEIYDLADQYNRKWLQVKRRIVEIRQNRT
ncbi:MAG: hypothetical protein JXQ30_04420 [Spirochaetes bacterium]|nr:hypothetical protein [Spirochaetota bacterium]